MASLWSQAQACAQEGLAAFRQEAQELVTISQQASEAADQARVAAQKEVNQTREALREADERILQLERRLAAESARAQSLEMQLDAASRQQTTLEAALADARKDYSAELDKSRQELRRTEERLEANQKRALLEIDHERQVTIKVQRELLQLRNSSLENEEQLRIELAGSKAELTDSRQKLGVEEGKQDELRSVYQKQLEEMATLRATVGKQETQLALLQREVELAQAASKQLHENIVSKPETPKVTRRSRKI